MGLNHPAKLVSQPDPRDARIMTARIDAFACDGLSLSVPRGTLGVVPAVFQESSSSSDSVASTGSCATPLQTSLQGSQLSGLSCAQPTEHMAAEQDTHVHASLSYNACQVQWGDSNGTTRNQAESRRLHTLCQTVEHACDSKACPNRPVAPVRILQRQHDADGGRSEAGHVPSCILPAPGVPPRPAHTPVANAETQTAVAIPCSNKATGGTGYTWSNFVAAARRSPRVAAAPAVRGHAAPAIRSAAHRPTTVEAWGSPMYTMYAAGTQAGLSPPACRLQSSLAALQADAALLLRDVRSRRRRMQ